MLGEIESGEEEFWFCSFFLECLYLSFRVCWLWKILPLAVSAVLLLLSDIGERFCWRFWILASVWVEIGCCCGSLGIRVFVYVVICCGSFTGAHDAFVCTEFLGEDSLPVLA